MPRYKFPATGTPGVHAKSSGNLGISHEHYQSALENGFPRVVQAIQALWGYKELNDYFRKLMIDDRGDRLGFPPEAWEEIDLLQHIHQDLFPDPRF